MLDKLLPWILFGSIGFAGIVRIYIIWTGGEYHCIFTKFGCF